MSGDAEAIRSKIFPRNLTARADYIVRGNPTSSRPESGVNNSFPGLEFDQRALDEKFFGGFQFEFHRPDGAIVAALRPTPAQRAAGLSEADSPPSRPLYLWFLFGCTRDSTPTPFMFHGQHGWEVGRRVRDLLPGRVAIIVGPGQPPPFSSPFAEMPKVIGQLEDAYREQTDVCTVARDATSGAIQSAVLAGDRARYLDDDGVIDVNLYAAGELTKTMCAPWMYDFRDCYCFYWASNKPDIVDVVENENEKPHRGINFIRADRSSPPPRDVAKWTNRDGALTPKKPGTNDPWERRRDTELTYKDMVEGWWERLPVVLNDREMPAPPPERLPRGELTPDQATVELTRLATVEHALLVEYLYAFYSLKMPAPPRPAGDDLATRIGFAAGQVFQIAIDEMRHLLWVNELLSILGNGNVPPSIGRAEVISLLSPVPGQPPHRFALERLTQTTLQWFIKVERPSADRTGMYVDLLRSVQNFPKPARLAPIIKLVVDEGAEHFRRFVAVNEALQGLREDQYLYDFRGQAQPNSEEELYLQLCDHYYQSILEAIHISFCQRERAGGEMVQAAIKSMQSFDDVARTLAHSDVPPRFELPSPLPADCPRTGDALDMLHRREQSLHQAWGRLADRGDAARADQAARHRQTVAAQFERMRSLVRRRSSGT